MTVGDGKTVPDPEYSEIKDRLVYFRYREKFGLSFMAMQQEPIDEVEFAIAVWAADGKRDKLSSRKQEAAYEEQRSKGKGQTVEPD